MKLAVLLAIFSASATILAMPHEDPTPTDTYYGSEETSHAPFEYYPSEDDYSGDGEGYIEEDDSLDYHFTKRDAENDEFTVPSLDSDLSFFPNKPESGDPANSDAAAIINNVFEQAAAALNQVNSFGKRSEVGDADAIINSVFEQAAAALNQVHSFGKRDVEDPTPVLPGFDDQNGIQAPSSDPVIPSPTADTPADSPIDSPVDNAEVKPPVKPKDEFTVPSLDSDLSFFPNKPESGDPANSDAAAIINNVFEQAAASLNQVNSFGKRSEVGDADAIINSVFEQAAAALNQVHSFGKRDVEDPTPVLPGFDDQNGVSSDDSVAAGTLVIKENMENMAKQVQDALNNIFKLQN